MNHSTHFRYAHIDRTQIPRDMRKRHAQEIVREHCYFMGFRISAENAMHYQHTLILAEEYESLINGIDDERGTILDQRLAMSLQDIELVFLRNLVMHDTTVIDYIDSSGLKARIHESLSKRDDHRFTVFGILGDKQPCLMHKKANDALTAMRGARWDSIKYEVKDFKPLDVRQAHPVTRELDVKFHQVADRFVKLISDSYGTGHLH